MRIAYFTTAQEPKEFDKFIAERKIQANTSNQVFHSSFVECLTNNNELLVFSCRTDSTQDNESNVKKTASLTWHYLATKKSSIKNFTNQYSEVGKVKTYTDIAFVDTTNLRCMLYARKFCKTKRIPLVGIVTDNPNNISNQKAIVSKVLSFFIKKCDAYVCLTEPLNAMFNKKNKANIIIKGISKNPAKIANKTPVDAPYFFYAGTLLKKYGIYDLIDAYNSLKNSSVKLVIAGHHEEEGFKDYIKDNPNIIYIGNISNSDILSYENGALANVNPRPFMQEIDDYSIPSKVVEYASKNAIVISGLSTSLKDDFKDTILWIDEKKTLTKRLQEAIKMGKATRATTIKEMNTICEKRFSINCNSKKISKFLPTVTK